MLDEELSYCFRIPHDAPPRWLCVLTAYLDESGQEGEDYVFIAGFLGNDEQWKQCAEMWRTGLGKRSALHMADLRWSKPHRIQPLLERLGRIPHLCKLEPLLGGVRVSDYKDLIGGTIDEQLMSGYMAALYPLVIQTLRWMPKDERIEFIFEDQERYKAFVGVVLSDIVNTQRDPLLLNSDGKSKLANWRFVPKSTTILTQPADYFAYALTQVYRDKNSERTKLCSPIFAQGSESEAIGAILTRNQVRGIVQVTRTMVDWERISGINMRPKNDAERKDFDAMIQAVIYGRLK